MQRVGMIIYKILRNLSVLGTLAAIYIAMFRAPIDRLTAFMLFVTPSILLYVFARILRRIMVGPLPPRQPRRRR